MCSVFNSEHLLLDVINLYIRSLHEQSCYNQGKLIVMGLWHSLHNVHGWPTHLKNAFRQACFSEYSRSNTPPKFPRLCRTTALQSTIPTTATVSAFHQRMPQRAMISCTKWAEALALCLHPSYFFIATVQVFSLQDWHISRNGRKFDAVPILVRVVN